ncbi:putative allantoate permease [Leptodontidium sp. 2 PMI_412]|nr:putative allantoate permease [Leptodontidium sp. 2 PMI_412]
MAISNRQQALPVVTESQYDIKREETCVEDIETKPTQRTGHVMTTFHSYSSEHQKAVEKRLLRRIDIHIMPLVVIIYIFSYLDRNSITQARLYGLQEDTHVTGAVYNTAIAIFSVGYVIMQLPSTVLMTKLRPSIYLPTCMIAWAIVSGSTAAASSPAGLLIARFMLGLIEAPFYPGAVYFLSCWYTKKELGIRMAFLISGLLLSNAFAGLISAGILSGMDGVGNLAAWRWLFILEGLATIVIAVIALVFLPDYPATTKWLTPEETIVAQGRLAQDAGSSDVLDEEKVSMIRGIKWAMKDPRTWMFAYLQMSASAAISYSHFFPTLIHELGFKSNTITLLLTSPPYILAFMWSLGLALSADKMQMRSPHAATSMIVGIVGAVLLIAVPAKQQYARYAFTFLVASGSFGVYSTTYTWLSSTIIRPPVKRAAAIGIANTISNCAALFGGYFWLDIYSPAFRESWGCELAFMFLGLACILTLRLTLKKANKRFDQLVAEVDPNDAQAMAALDDDSQRAVLNGFRYII